VRGRPLFARPLAAAVGGAALVGSLMTASPGAGAAASLPSRSDTASVESSAGAPASPLESGASVCPRAEAVWSELQTVVARDHTGQDTRPGAPGAPALEIVDLGGTFRVVANGRAREYRDEARDCARRARVAAVFVAVALGPPLAAPAEPAQPAASVTAAAPEPPARATRVELGAAMETGVASADRATLAGAALRVSVGRGALMFTAGAAVLAPSETSVGTVTVRQLHVPVDVGLRAAARAGRFGFTADLGLAAGVLRVRAVDLATPLSTTIVEWGARGGVALRYQASARLAPFVAADARLVVGPAALYALPHGVIGHAPPLWIGAVAGAAMAF
jgi:hypothetical protein